jgi:hypothetical protein
MQTPSGSYQVLAAKNIHGTNLHFSADSPFEISLRRNLDRLGVHLKGDRGKPGFAEDIGIHAIALRYQDRVPAGDLSQVLFECVTESGQTVRLNHRIIMQGSRGRTCLIFFYADSAIPDLYRLGFCESEVTNFCPVQLRLLRKSDHFELSRLDLEH